jgi:hypothetical protein
MAAIRIPPYYDSLIGKLIVHGRDRPEALARLRRALSELVVDGVDTTVPLFHALLANPTSRRASTTSTGWKSGSPRSSADPGRCGPARAAANVLQEANKILRGILTVTGAITAELLLRAYAMGIFPMAEGRDDPTIHWIDPRHRGILPLDGFHLSRSLARRIRRSGWHVTADRDFAGVLDACADRPETWINAPIRALYLTLFDTGFAHSWKSAMVKR